MFQKKCDLIINLGGCEKHGKRILCLEVYF